MGILLTDTGTFSNTGTWFASSLTVESKRYIRNSEDAILKYLRVCLRTAQCSQHKHFVNVKHQEHYWYHLWYTFAMALMVT